MLVVPGTGVLIDQENNNYILNIKDKAKLNKIVGILPKVFTQPYEDGTLVVLPIHEDTLQFLRNQGLPTRGMEPFYFKYHPPLIEGKYKAMAHQVTSAAFMSSHKRCFNTSTMRTGKTGSVTMATDFLQAHMPTSVLIVATVSNLTGVWEKTIRETTPNKSVAVLHGTRDERLRRLKLHADYYIINYDGVKMLADELYSLVESGKIKIVVVDELTHYGNHKSQRWQALNKVVNGKVEVEHVIGLTGSPAGDTLAIFGFVKLINPINMPYKHLGTWKDLVQWRYGRESWMWRDRDNAGEIIHKAMQPTIRFEKQDIMDLPPVVTSNRDADMTAEQQKSYEQMLAEMIMIADSGEMVEAVHKASLIGKLLQISQGCVLKGDGTIVELDDKHRFNTLLEVIKEAEQKVVIFTAFKAVLHRLVRQLRFSGYTVDAVDGDVTGKKRDRIFSAFQERPDPHIVVCHPQTTAFGVELAAADTMIFYGPPRSGGFVFEQALERLSSLKQKAAQISIVFLSATKEERECFKGLESGAKFSEVTNRLFATITKK